MTAELRRQEIESNLASVRAEIESFHPTLVVVTKTYPASDVQILSDLGERNFGENRSSEGLEKSAIVPATWHYQGEVQSKKIREILSWATIIHSIDQRKHLDKCDVIAGETNRKIEIFLQLSLDGDPERGGVIERELFELAAHAASLSEVKLLGIMCVPPVAADLKTAYSELSVIHQRFTSEFPESSALSAGMSGDYMVALEHGATHIRVGTSILGARNYR